jgi:hypothetical protein
MVKNTTSSAVILVSDDPISERAHEIYVARGRADGSDLDDWLRAERELNHTPPTSPDPVSARAGKRAKAPSPVSHARRRSS